MRAILVLGLALLLLAPHALAKPAVTVEVPMAEKWSKPQTPVAYEIALTRASDATIEVVFRLVRTTGEALAVMPNPIKLAHDDRITLPLMLQSPWENGYVTDTSTATYSVETRDPQTKAPVGEPQEFTLTLHTKGMYVPGPQLFAAMLAVALAALLLRRRA